MQTNELFTQLCNKPQKFTLFQDYQKQVLFTTDGTVKKYSYKSNFASQEDILGFLHALLVMPIDTDVYLKLKKVPCGYKIFLESDNFDEVINFLETELSADIYNYFSFFGDKYSCKENLGLYGKNK